MAQTALGSQTSQTIQEAQPNPSPNTATASNPKKPISVHILLLIYLLLGLLIGTIATWILLDSFINLDTNQTFIGIAVLFFLLSFAFFSVVVGFFIYTKTSILVGFFISIFILMSLLAIAFNKSLESLLFGPGLKGEEGFGLIGVGLTLMFFEAILLLGSLASIPIIISSISRFKTASLEKRR